jgi:hypothetical protein
MPAEVPAQPETALGGDVAAERKNIAAKVELRTALQSAQSLATCALVAVHAQQAEAVRVVQHEVLRSTEPPAAASVQALGNAARFTLAAARPSAPAITVDDPAEQRAAALRAVQASIRAELDALQVMHLLLNDRDALQCSDHAAAKLVLERAKACRAGLERLRQQCAAEFEAARLTDEGDGEVRFWP